MVMDFLWIIFQVITTNFINLSVFIKPKIKYIVHKLFQLNTYIWDDKLTVPFYKKKKLMYLI